MENKQFQEWLLRSKYNTESVFTPFCTSVTEIKVGKYKGEYVYDYDCRDFYKLPFAVQWGIYLVFFDTVDIPLEYLYEHYSPSGKSREENQINSVKKAFELLVLSEKGQQAAKSAEDLRNKYLEEK